MFSDEEIRDLPESNYGEDKDEIISVIEVCLDDKFDKRDLGFHGEPVLLNCSKNDLDVSRTIFEGLDQHRDGFPWVEEDSNISELVSEPRLSGDRYDEEFDGELGNGDVKDADISSSSSAARSSVSRHGVTFTRKQCSSESRLVSSSSSMGAGGDSVKSSGSGGKIDKTDPRTRMHFVKYLKRQGRTVKLWECGICAREFQHQYTLMRHLPTHTDERNFHCEVCGKSFRQLSTLSQHRAIHSSQRPYSCEVCNKTFNRVSTLISHRKTHSEDKPYKCHLCPKGFHQKGNLRNHLFTHTNERPYRCDVCYKGFNQQSNLVCHKIKAHTAEGPGTQSSTQRIRRHYHPRMNRQTESVPDSTKPQTDYCEVTSSVGPYLPSVDYPTSSNWPKKTPTKPGPDWSTDAYWASMTSNGVLVDPIKTYHMGVALATKQTPFALLKPDNGTPVLVKVVDMKLPSGKQMLVPATAEDLKDSGKIITEGSSNVVQDSNAVQIRVPVVATVVPRVKPGGRLHLTVEEPHYAYHTALSADIGTVSIEPCSLKAVSPAAPVAPPVAMSSLDKRFGTPPPLLSCPGFERNDVGGGAKPLLAWVLSQGPSPSPPLDLITLDLFDPVDASQIPAVSNHGTAHSDDSDIFIGKFEVLDEMHSSSGISSATGASFAQLPLTPANESIGISDSD